MFYGRLVGKYTHFMDPMGEVITLPPNIIIQWKMHPNGRWVDVSKFRFQQFHLNQDSVARVFWGSPLETCFFLVGRIVHLDNIWIDIRTSPMDPMGKDPKLRSGDLKGLLREQWPSWWITQKQPGHFRVDVVTWRFVKVTNKNGNCNNRCEWYGDASHNMILIQVGERWQVLWVTFEKQKHQKTVLSKTSWCLDI